MPIPIRNPKDPKKLGPGWDNIIYQKQDLTIESHYSLSSHEQVH